MSGARGTRSEAGINRLLAKLKAEKDNSKYYEAHQLYRTIHFRLCSQRKFAEDCEILTEGAFFLFKADQPTSGLDLISLQIDAIDSSSLPFDDQLMERLARIFVQVPVSNPDRDALECKLLNLAFRHTNDTNRFHHILAYALWDVKRYAESLRHFYFTPDGAGCGKMLVEFNMAEGYSFEAELFIYDVVLQFLYRKKHLGAAHALKVYTFSHPNIQKGPPYSHPLLNFVWLLLLVVEQKKSLTIFSSLVESYKKSITVSPISLSFLDKIGQNYYEVPPPVQPRPSGLFARLFEPMVNQDVPRESETRCTMTQEDLD